MSRITVRDDVLNTLRSSTYGLSTHTIASYVCSPAPSVRRCIAELKAAGHNIIREGKQYRLVQPQTAGI